MEENFYYIELFEIYKNLLTDKQKEIFEMHFSLDLSLSEIAEEKEITRQNVSDTLKNAKDKLKEYENILGVKKKTDEILDICKEISDGELVVKIKNVIGK